MVGKKKQKKTPRNKNKGQEGKRDSFSSLMLELRGGEETRSLGKEKKKTELKAQG